jgi:hypothetical protein
VPPDELKQMITNYDEFWDFYVQEHSKPMTRVLHFAGTSLGIILLVWFVSTGRWYFFPLVFLPDVLSCRLRVRVVRTFRRREK